MTGGTVTDNGEIDLTGNSVIKSGTLGNTGQITVSNLGNTLIRRDRDQHRRDQRFSGSAP